MDLSPQCLGVFVLNNSCISDVVVFSYVFVIIFVFLNVFVWGHSGGDRI